MAGGPLAQAVMCPVCADDDGVVVRGDRVREGVESDDYVCERGHRFGMSWRSGPATTPQWPPPDDEKPAPRR